MGPFGRPAVQQARPTPGAGPSTQPEDLEGRLVDLIRRDAVRIPPFPAVAFQLSRLLADEKSTLEELSKVAGADQIVAAGLLRAAKTAAQSRGSDQLSLAKAIARLGAKETQRLVFAITFGGLTRTPGPLHEAREKIWRDSVVCAFVAADLAQRRGLARDELFLCGLLHDFGKIVVMSAVEELLRAESPALAACAMDVVERFHVEIGLVTATRWGLPEALIDAMARHHLPPAAAAKPEIIEVLAIADAVAHLIDAAPGVTALDVGAIPYLRPKEGAWLVELIAQLPGRVAGLLNLGAAGDAAAASTLQQHHHDRWREVSFPAIVREDRPITFEVRFVHSQGFVIAGPVALVENHLHAFELCPSEESLALWGFSRLTLKDGAAFVMDIKPFATAGAAFESLRAMLSPVPAPKG